MNSKHLRTASSKIYKFKLYCNYCSEIFSIKEENELLLTSCRHIICVKCIIFTQHDMNCWCTICKKMCKVLFISKQMPKKWLKYVKGIDLNFIRNKTNVLLYKLKQMKICIANQTKYAQYLKYYEQKLYLKIKQYECLYQISMNKYLKLKLLSRKS